MDTNAFYCPICARNTRHIEVRLVEAAATQGRGRMFQIMSGAGESHSRMIKTAMGRNLWKCCECTAIYIRDNAGEILDVIKQGSPNQRNDNVVYIPQNTLNILVNSTTINNFYFTGGEPSDYPWLHKHSGFMGRNVDRYKIVLHGDKISSFEARMGLAGTLCRLGLGERSKFKWQLSQGRKIQWENLTESEAIEIYEKLKNSPLIDYIEIT